jgi:hypothetical protein
VSIGSLLLLECEQEARITRATLERVPLKPEFAPHPKSMPLGRLAPHVAQLGSFGVTVLTTPGLDFSTAGITPLPFESAGQLVQAFDEGMAKVCTAIESLPEAAWSENWRLAFNGKTIFEGHRFLAYRAMFLNHLVHHRAQLGVYLRLNGVPLPSTYGPSADETLGF